MRHLRARLAFLLALLIAIPASAVEIEWVSVANPSIFL